MSKLQLFNEKRIRTKWDAEQEEWYFSVVDVCGVISESNTPRNYWSDLKRKLKLEGSELHEKIVQLKLLAEDGKMRLTDVLDTKGILRLIQSIPSKNAEPFKMWLAEVGNQRLDEMVDPSKAIDRALNYYRKKGYSEEWINERIRSIGIRKELIDEWKSRGVNKGTEFAILTNEMTKAWSGFTVKEYKEFKGLKKENLRDNMTNLELTLNQLAEVTTSAISKQVKPTNFDENKKVAIKGGNIAKTTKEQIEAEIKQSVISPLNNKKKNQIN